MAADNYAATMQRMLDEANKESTRLEEEMGKFQEAQIKQFEQIEECKAKLSKAKEQVVRVAAEAAQEAKDKAEKDADKDDDEKQNEKVEK